MYISTLSFLLPLALLPGALSWGILPSNHSSLPLVPYTYPPLEQIRYTLSLETFLLDAKDWPALNLVYTDDAVANFSSLGAGVCMLLLFLDDVFPFSFEFALGLNHSSLCCSRFMRTNRRISVMGLGIGNI